jgi:hypothetical protein
MAAQAQLELYDGSTATRRTAPGRAAAAPCAGCREREARYGFREAGGIERARTLCFTCFRMELDRRRIVEAQLRRGWDARQVDLPLCDTLHELTIRRRRAQIAARHAIA